MKKDYLYLIIFAVALILFSFFSVKTSFHDSHEFIVIAKYFSGINNIDLFVGHSIVYPWLMSFILKIWPSFFTINIINALWVFLIGIVLILINKKAFTIFAFSPLTWYSSIQTSPVLPSSFFFLLSFIFFKKKELKYNLLLSGVFLGISIAFYTPLLLIGFIFTLVYFWGINLSQVIRYLLAVFIGVLPRFIIDFYYFKMPLYTFIRYAGANLIVSIGLHPETTNIHLLSNSKIFLIFFVISPLLFKLYKVDFREYKKEIIFIILSFLILLTRGALFKYFLIISPIIIFLLVKVFSKKDIKWHCIISVFIVIFLTWNFFSDKQDETIKNDINSIIKDYKVDYIIGSNFESLTYAVYSWENKPYFVWFSDYNSSLKNEIVFKEYSFDIESKIPLRENIEISALFKRPKNKIYNDYIIVSKNNETDLELDKCYEVLCVYTNQ